MDALGTICMLRENDTHNLHTEVTASCRRLVRHALFQEPLEPSDKAVLRSRTVTVTARESLTNEERAKWNTLSAAHQTAVELLLSTGGDVQRAHALYESGRRTLPYFRVLCKRAGAALKGGEYSLHNFDKSGKPY